MRTRNVLSISLSPSQNGVVLIAWALLGLPACAQMASEYIRQQDVGRPPRPPLITVLGLAGLTKMTTDPSLPPSGPVAEVFYEEIRSRTMPAGPAGETIESIRTKYDEQGRAVEKIQRAYGAVTTSIIRYDGDHLISEEATFSGGRTEQPKAWNYWKYDEHGKVIDYKRGRGEKLENHETNFTRDAQGRLTGFEYRQGAQDALFTRTEFRYSADGKTIDTVLYNAAGEVMNGTTEMIDDSGHVIQVIMQDGALPPKKLKEPLNVVFKYDGKGRLVEQSTDPYELSKTGAEHELPPGKVSIAYDETKHTKMTSYSSTEGSLISKVTYDGAGAVVGMAVETGGEFIEAQLECQNDSHNNWISCEQVTERSGVRIVSKKWRRTIIYR